MSNADYEKKWLKGELDESEKKAFEKTEEHAFLVKLQSALLHFGAPKYNLSNEEKRLEGQLLFRPVKTISWPGNFLKIAASIVFILASVYVIYQINDQPADKTLSGTISEKSSIFLPDSSHVFLNKKTTISYDWTTSRRVALSGEAYFSVRHGSTFDVLTELATVSVVGTEFNVKVWDDFLEVSCFEGSVKISSDGEEVLLKQNESWSLIGNNPGMVVKQMEEFPDWQRGESKFDGIPLKYVFKELERQYDVSITGSDVDLEQSFTGAFPHDNINLALKSISVPLDLSYQLEDKQLKITKSIR